MVAYQISLPESLNISDFDLKMLVASKFFEEGKLSSGQAAQVVGISKKSFIEILGKYSVSIFGQASFEEIEQDMKNA